MFAFVSACTRRRCLAPVLQACLLCATERQAGGCWSCGATCCLRPRALLLWCVGTLMGWGVHPTAGVARKNQ